MVHARQPASHQVAGARRRVSVSAVLGAGLGVVAVLTIPLGAVSFAVGAAAIAGGLVSREKMRHDWALQGVPLSMIAVLLGGVAIFFTGPGLLLWLSHEVQMTWPF